MPLFRIIFLFSICSFSFLKAQDLIILKNGNKLYCKIVFEDSSSIYYSRPPQKTQIELRKSEVATYTWKNDPSKDSTSRSKRELFLLDIAGGFVKPIDEFASMDASDIKSGLAKNGYAIRGTGILKLVDYFGISLSYIYQKNKLDEAPVVNLLSNTYNTTFTAAASYWRTSGMMFGVYFSVPVKQVDHLSVYSNLSFGAPTHVLPSLQTTGAPYGSKITLTQFEARTKSFAFHGGLGFSYKTSDFLSFKVAANYFYSKPQFSDIYTESTTGYFDYGDYSQKITTINIEAGFSVIMNRRR